MQQQRLLHAENIEDLRAELKQGEACLVCGSTEHPYREDESPVSESLICITATAGTTGITARATMLPALADYTATIHPASI